MKELWASGNKKPSRLKARKKMAIRQFSNLLCDGRPGIIASTSAMLIRLSCILSFSGVTINIFMIVKLKQLDRSELSLPLLKNIVAQSSCSFVSRKRQCLEKLRH
jgi:hypothetical protein